MGWEYIVVLIISLAVSYALAPKPTAPKPHALEDFDVPVAEEGKEMAVIFGTCDVGDPNVLWYGDLQVQAIKGGSGKK